MLIFFISSNILYIQETLAVRLESQNKGNIQLKQKYDELKAMSAAKDELIARLENEMREQMAFVDKTIKVLYIKLRYINLGNFVWRCGGLMV